MLSRLRAVSHCRLAGSLRRDAPPEYETSSASRPQLRANPKPAPAIALHSDGSLCRRVLVGPHWKFKNQLHRVVHARSNTPPCWRAASEFPALAGRVENAQPHNRRASWPPVPPTLHQTLSRDAPEPPRSTSNLG